jgi:RNA polymerase sigma-70 factor, ECF subfamily
MATNRTGALVSGELDDRALTRARAGDQTCLATLVETYQRRVYALVGRMMLGRPQLVDDLAQETFIKVLRGLSRFDPNGPARLSTWILTIATRTCLDMLRQKTAPTEELSPLLPSDANPEAEAENRQLGRRVEAAMTRLPEEMRAVLVLRAYHDFDYPDIAAALGLELGTVKSRLGRARSALREALQEPLKEPR